MEERDFSPEIEEETAEGMAIVEIEDKALGQIALGSTVPHEETIETPKRRPAEPNGELLKKDLNFYIKVDDISFFKQYKVSSFHQFPAKDKVLLAIGQANSNSWFDTEEKRFDFACKMVNKAMDKKKILSDEEVLKLIEEHVEEGTLLSGEHGPEISRAGLEYIKDKYKGRRGRPKVR